MKLHTTGAKALLDQVVKLRELMITMPSKNVKGFKQKMSTLKHYAGVEARLTMKTVKDEEGITTLHLILGDGIGMDVEYYEIKEVESL